MQAILKGKHHRFCEMVQSIRNNHPEAEDQLLELEKDLKDVFNDYQKRLDDIKLIKMDYDRKHKAIRMRIRLLQNKKSKLEKLVFQGMVIFNSFFCLEEYFTISGILNT